MKASLGDRTRASTRVRPIAITTLLSAVLAAACAHGRPNDEPAPLPAANAIRLADGWQATVLVQRDDSIILTLPSGDQQTQRFDRQAGLTLIVDGNGRMSLRLDSMTLRPRGDKVTIPLGATWSSRAGDADVGAMRVTGGGDPAAELTAVVRNLLPRLPPEGVHARMTWSDSSTGQVRVDIFRASEHRTAKWSAGTLSDRSGANILPVLVREEFEQLGDGMQGGRKLTMTSQGSRIGTYYVMADGRMSGAELSDSVAMMISVPDLREVVPTIRYARTSVRFLYRAKRDS
ncbi:MAG: hypothetical protein ACREK8_04115 [Gemmatimonadales bacterium]